MNPNYKNNFWKWQSTPVLLPGKSHGQRNLVGYSPWGHKESDTTESDTTERLHFHLKKKKQKNPTAALKNQQE